MMARTKQTARKSSGGLAPRRQLATRNSFELRTYLTSQQASGTVIRDGEVVTSATSFLNHENVLGQFSYPLGAEVDDFAVHMATKTTLHPQTGLNQHWLSVQWASKYDGAGMGVHGRPPLSVMLVIDISGSMSCKLEGDDESGGRQQSKLDVAKRVVHAVLDQLQPSDYIGVQLFNREVRGLHALSACTATTKQEIREKLAHVTPFGGTDLGKGFGAGLTSLEAAGDRTPLRRTIFVTDMQSSEGDEASVLSQAAQAATMAVPLHTTVVGVGVDLSVGTVERLSAIPGAKYTSVSNALEFESSVSSDFAHDVMPIAYGIRLELKGGWTIMRACGSAELNTLAQGTTAFEVSSEFAAPLDETGHATGGVILLELTAPPSQPVPPGLPTITEEGTGAPRRQSPRLARSYAAVATAAVYDKLGVCVSWTGADGRPASIERELGVRRVAAAEGERVAMEPEQVSLRKALALTRFVDMQKDFCDAGDELSLESRLERLKGFRSGREALIQEMRALGDETLHGSNKSFLQTLDQIIELEARETAHLSRLEAERQARNDADVPATSGSAARTTRASRQCKRAVVPNAPDRVPAQRTRMSAGVEASMICPILHTRMVDPVCTADGHTFERSAIERWLQTHNTSPLTGLTLQSKALTPNHVLRAMLQA